VASGSSAKKVARLAQRGKGKKVRFQGGSVFPAVMTVVVVLGLALVAYARQSEPDTGSTASASEISYAAYGFYKCDGFLDNLVAPEDEEVDNTQYRLTSSTPGVMEWRPAGLPRYRAKLGVFLDAYGISLDTKELTFPQNQNNGESFKMSDLKCKDSDGKEVDAQVQVIVWDSHDNPASSRKYITDFGNIRIDQDLMAVAIAFAPAGAEIPLPPSAENLLSVPASEDAILAGAAPPPTVAATTTTVATDTTGG